jgi:hypothetical protein
MQNIDIFEVIRCRYVKTRFGPSPGQRIGLSRAGGVGQLVRVSLATSMGPPCCQQLGDRPVVRAAGVGMMLPASPPGQPDSSISFVTSSQIRPGFCLLR